MFRNLFSRLNLSSHSYCKSGLLDLLNWNAVRVPHCFHCFLIFPNRNIKTSRRRLIRNGQPSPRFLKTKTTLSYLFCLFIFSFFVRYFPKCLFVACWFPAPVIHSVRALIFTMVAFCVYLVNKCIRSK